MFRDLEDSFFDRFENLQVTRAPAKVAGKRIADLIPAGVGILVQQRFGRYQDAGGTIAALRGTQVRECLLKRMKTPFSREAFQSR